MPCRRRPGAGLRAQRRHQPRLRSRERHRRSRQSVGLEDGYQGRRRAPLLARSRFGLRRPVDGLDPQLGRADTRQHARRAAAGAANPRRRCEQVIPGGLCAFRLNGLSAADAVLLALPLVGRDHSAVAVLRRRRRRRRLRGSAREDQSRHARAVATRGPAARRVPQLLDRLRAGRKHHAGGDPGLLGRRAAHAG